MIWVCQYVLEDEYTFVFIFHLSEIIHINPEWSFFKIYFTNGIFIICHQYIWGYIRGYINYAKKKENKKKYNKNIDVKIKFETVILKKRYFKLNTRCYL